jgi:hypothetical protein
MALPYLAHSVSIVLQQTVDEADSFYFNYQGRPYRPGVRPGPTTDQLWAVSQAKIFQFSKRLNAITQNDYDDLGQITWGTIGRDSWKQSTGYQFPTPVYFKLMTYRDSNRASISIVDDYNDWGKNPVWLYDSYPQNVFKFSNRGVYFSFQFVAAEGAQFAQFTILVNTVKPTAEGE